jgi:MerR family transcriptional regulator, light-induced transcriptional regulator
MQDQAFNIQFVSNITGINPHTIRAWEKRYQAIEPGRDHNGRRLYTNTDIERLNALNKLVRMGNSISDIATLSSEELNRIGEQFAVQNKVTKKFTGNFDYENTIKNIYLGLKFFKLDIVNHELNKAANELSAVDFALNIVAPIITNIRNLKKTNSLGKEERIQIYLILKSHLIKKIYQTNVNNNLKQKVIIAAAAGALNELGSMLATILFLDKGYEVEFLGGNVESESLGKIAAQFKPDIVFIGLNYSHEPEQTMADKGQYLEVVNQYLNIQTKVMIGAYDVCFNLPNMDYECFLEFVDIHRSL